MAENNKIFGQQKILNHPDKIANWLNGKDDTLITVEFDMTNECNAHCPGCIGGRANQESLGLLEAKNYIDQLAELGVKGIMFTGGGEPTLNSATAEAINHAKQKGLDVGLITNGISLADETVKAIVENCAWCRVSLDAGTPEMYRAIHNAAGDVYDCVLKNISRLVAAKRDTNSACTIGVGYLTGQETISGMLDFTKVAKDLGVDYAQFRPFHNDYCDITEQYGRCQALAAETFKVISSIQKYSRFNDENKKPYAKCHGVHFCTVICADGAVQTCCHTRGKEKYILGSLKNQPLREIWKNRRAGFEKIDFQDCGPAFCRADEFNRLLFDLTQDKQHINFL